MVYQLIFTTKRKDAITSAKLFLNVVTDAPKNALNVGDKYSMDTVNKNVEDNLFATMNAKTFAAATVHLVIYLAQSDVPIQNACLNVDFLVFNASNRVYTNANTQNALNFASSHAIESLVNNLVKNYLLAGTNV